MVTGTVDRTYAQALSSARGTVQQVANILGDEKEAKETKKESVALRRKWTKYETQTWKEARHDHKVKDYLKQKVVNILVDLGNFLRLYKIFGHKAEELTHSVKEQLENPKAEKKAELIEADDSEHREEVKTTTVSVQEHIKPEVLLSAAPTLEREITDTAVKVATVSDEDEGFEEDLELEDLVRDTSSSMQDLMLEAEELDEYQLLLRDPTSYPAIIARQSQYTGDIREIEQAIKEKKVEITVVSEPKKKEAKIAPTKVEDEKIELSNFDTACKVGSYILEDASNLTKGAWSLAKGAGTYAKDTTLDLIAFGPKAGKAVIEDPRRGLAALTGASVGALSIYVPTKINSYIEKKGWVDKIAKFSNDNLYLVSKPFAALYGTYKGITNFNPVNVSNLLGVFIGEKPIEAGVLNYLQFEKVRDGIGKIVNPLFSRVTLALAPDDKEKQLELVKIQLRALDLTNKSYFAYNMLGFGAAAGSAILGSPLTLGGLGVVGALGGAYMAYKRYSAKLKEETNPQVKEDSTPQETDSKEEAVKSKAEPEIQIFESKKQVADVLSHIQAILQDREFQKENRQLILDYQQIVSDGQLNNEVLIGILVAQKSLDEAMKKRSVDGYETVKERLLQKYPFLGAVAA